MSYKKWIGQIDLNNFAEIAPKLDLTFLTQSEKFKVNESIRLAKEVDFDLKQLVNFTNSNGETAIESVSLSIEILNSIQDKQVYIGAA